MWAGFYQKHVTHVREHLIYYNFSFLTEQSFLKRIKFIAQSYLSLSNSILLLVVSIFSVFLKSLNDYFLVGLLTSLIVNELQYVVFQSFFDILFRNHF